MRDTIRVVV